MIHGWLFWLTLIAALGCGVVAGVFYAFSSFVMKALARLPAPIGISAMQSINIEAPMPPFMAAFLGTAVTSAAVVVIAIVEWDEPYAGYLLAGGLLYLIGAIGLTAVYHIPRNDALVAMESDSAVAAEYWSYYVPRWTAWNHVRTAAALGAAALLVEALRAG